MSSRSRGFSLIELLLALTTTLALSAMVFHLFHRNERTVRDQTLLMEMQHTAQVVASQIADEIRMAGQGVPVHSSKFDVTIAESVAVVLPTSSNDRIDFRAGLSAAEAAVTGAPPLTSSSTCKALFQSMTDPPSRLLWVQRCLPAGSSMSGGRLHTPPGPGSARN